MRIVKRGGKVLMNAGKLVTNNNCCCDACLEDCVDAEISVSLPAFTTNVGCTNCEDVPAGPFTLSSYTPASPDPGSCYWRNLAPGGSGSCELDSIHAEMSIVAELVSLTITVETATGSVHTFYSEYSKCDFCAEMPGYVVLDPIGGECDTTGLASMLFASACCHPPDCNCNCFHEAETLTFTWVTEPLPYHPDDCTFNLCRDTLVGFPAGPYTLTKVVDSGDSFSAYRFQFDGETGGNWGIELTCDLAPDLSGSCDDCDEPHWEKCEYVVVITCSNACSLVARRCVKTLPTAGFPMTFRHDDVCSENSPQNCNNFGDVAGCDPWEFTISE